MKKNEFYERLDELLELEPGTIKGGELLKDLPRWDSLAVMGFIALLDRDFSVRVAGSRIVACDSVADLEKLTGTQFE